MKSKDFSKTLLIVDDDPIFCKYVFLHFSQRDLNIVTAGTGNDAKKICKEQFVDIVFLDQNLPDIKGIDLCTYFLSCNDQCKIIFITAFPCFKTAVAALKEGVFDYLSKPVDLTELELALEKSLRTLSLEKTEQIQGYHTRRQNEETTLIENHGGLGGLHDLVKRSASSSSPVLITGETGVGKSIVAKSIHFNSQARDGPFININCATFSESLIESELFGHEKGAFTGAEVAKKGIFEMAEGGTLFLDEIGMLPLHLQTKLLGVLDDHSVRRLGCEFSRPVNVRIISATNLDIEQAVVDKCFRQDLYFRLSVIRIVVPPLRQRPHDISELCRFFLKKVAKNQNISLPEEEEAVLKAYHWPGNIRELKNIIERSFILRSNEILRPSLLLNHHQGFPAEAGPASLSSLSPSQRLKLMTLWEMERNHIQETLLACSGNRTHAAKSLGISRATLIRKLKAYQDQEGTDHNETLF